jgi:hypothetical protein
MHNPKLKILGCDMKCLLSVPLLYLSMFVMLLGA